jgi:hypothetical protein
MRPSTIAVSAGTRRRETVDDTSRRHAEVRYGRQGSNVTERRAWGGAYRAPRLCRSTGVWNIVASRAGAPALPSSDWYARGANPRCHASRRLYAARFRAVAASLPFRGRGRARHGLNRRHRHPSCTAGDSGVVDGLRVLDSVLPAPYPAAAWPRCAGQPSRYCRRPDRPALPVVKAADEQPDVQGVGDGGNGDADVEGRDLECGRAAEIDSSSDRCAWRWPRPFGCIRSVTGSRAMLAGVDRAPLNRRSRGGGRR